MDRLQKSLGFKFRSESSCQRYCQSIYSTAERSSFRSRPERSKKLTTSLEILVRSNQSCDYDSPAFLRLLYSRIWSTVCWTKRIVINMPMIDERYQYSIAASAVMGRSKVKAKSATAPWTFRHWRRSASANDDRPIFVAAPNGGIWRYPQFPSSVKILMPQMLRRLLLLLL